VSDTNALGFIGLGQIGKPMAQRWLDWPGGLVVTDVNPDAVTELVDAGAFAAVTAAELAAQVQLVSVMVRDDAQVLDVVSGPDGILAGAASGTVIAIHSTIHAETAIKLEAEAATKGVLVVDAPVSGGSMGASSGRLALMVGGTDEAFAACTEPFAKLGDLVVHAGPTGSGTKMKLARNLMHFVAFTAATEAQRLAEAAGLSAADLGNVVRHSDAVTGGPGAIMYRGTAAPIPPDDFWFDVMGHVRALGEKDLALAIELAAELDVDIPLAQLALERLGPGLGLPS
jgi:3-hydroxyisobutyrate dehydrogenase-like beta-hydroxyacid dehydrogenase